MSDSLRPSAPQPLPLEGLRILAVEQMQAMPFATQLLARMGADVVKVESPKEGESGRTGLPNIRDVDGSTPGATVLRNNLSKRSIGIDLKHPKGAELVRKLVPKYDVVVENFKPGTMERLGLGYETLAKLHPRLVYVSASGFGSLRPTPYGNWPAYACVAEAMGGFYSFRPGSSGRPNIGVGGAIGDIGTGLFATIGLLTALRGRDQTGKGQKVDVAMLDAIISIMDMVAFNPSIGVHDNSIAAWPGILESFAAKDGLFVLQVGRVHQFERLAETIGHPEWKTDPRFATREQWSALVEPVVRPAVEGWARDKTKLEASRLLAEAGVVAGPSYEGDDLLADPHVRAHEMIVEIPAATPTGVVRVHGNPIKFSASPEGPATKWPLIGEHTTEILRADLGLAPSEIDGLRAEGVIR
ncbi:MAG: CaiB/BaiF CoA-transferase family protein [Myxococcota bacterium]